MEFWSSLGYQGYLLVLLGTLFCVHLFLIIGRGRTLVSKKKFIITGSQEGVSVILTCANKAEFLEKNLEAFLTQDYPEYEVIVVDECSEDETQDVLSEFQKKYPHLKTSRIFPETKFRRTKKIAINIGVLAARYDILLFSEIHDIPESDEWVKTMASYFAPDTAVVIGYSNYAAEGEKNNVKRYFRFLWFWKTVTLLKKGIYVTGNGNNMGYRKKYYLERRGFSGNTQEYIGYDTEMVCELSRKGKVKAVKEPKARVVMEEQSKKTWKDDFSYYYATKRRWSVLARMCSSADFFIETGFYLLAFYFVIFTSLYKYVAVGIILTFLIDFIVINVCLRHLGLRKLFLTSFTVNTFGFIYKWYYSIYSIFTAKKWR